MDPMYCLQLIDRFPRSSRWTTWIAAEVAQVRSGARRSRLQTACLTWTNSMRTVRRGGRINGMYMHGDVFRMYPRVERRAILFHSIEPGALEDPGTKASIATADLVVARTHQSAENAKAAGAQVGLRIFRHRFSGTSPTRETRPEIAVALRSPNYESPRATRPPCVTSWRDSKSPRARSISSGSKNRWAER